MSHPKFLSPLYQNLVQRHKISSSCYFSGSSILAKRQSKYSYVVILSRCSQCATSMWLSNARPQLLMQKGVFGAQFHPSSPTNPSRSKADEPSSPIAQLLSSPFLEKELMGSLAEWTIYSLRPCPFNAQYCS
jgi:hypothetical protein